MADTLSASSGIWWNEAAEALASVQTTSAVPSLLERFRQKVANATRSKVAPLAMALGLAMAPACTTDKSGQESFVNPNSGIPDAPLVKPADTAVSEAVKSTTEPTPTDTNEVSMPNTEQELEAYLLTRNYSPDERKEIITTMNGLTERNYSPAERKEILTLLERSRDFTREYKLDSPLSRVYFSPKDNTPSERLAAVNANLAKLAVLPSKTIPEAIGADQVTPENMSQVITFVHTANDAERDAIYGTDHTPGGDWDKKGGAWTRVIAGQGVKWQANLPKLSEESMQKACDLANMFLAHQVHRSVEWSRLVVTSALDFVYTPKISETVTAADQKANLKNRSLNLAQELAWMTTMTSTDMPWGTKPEEIAKITVGQFTYSFAPQERIAQIPGLSDDKKAITIEAYEMLQNAQTKSVASVQSGRDNKKLDAEIKQIEAHSKETEAHSKETEAHSKETEAHSEAAAQHADITSSVELVRRDLLSIIEVYLKEKSPEQRTIMHANIRKTTERLIQAEKHLWGIQPLNEENAQQKTEELGVIRSLYDLVHTKTWIDVESLKKEPRLS